MLHASTPISRGGVETHVRAYTRTDRTLLYTGILDQPGLTESPARPQSVMSGLRISLQLAAPASPMTCFFDIAKSKLPFFEKESFKQNIVGVAPSCYIPLKTPYLNCSQHRRAFETALAHE